MQVSLDPRHDARRRVLVDFPDDGVAPVHQRDLLALFDLERVGLVDPHPVQAQLRLLTRRRVLLMTRDS